MTDLLLLLMLTGAAAACSGAAPQSGARLLASHAADADLWDDCALAERRCTRCHSLDRVEVARVAAPWDWFLYVERMRRMPSSMISPAEGRRITRCLVFRSFGADGLAELEGGGR